jgi:hypothetical protein
MGMAPEAFGGAGVLGGVGGAGAGVGGALAVGRAGFGAVEGFEPMPLLPLLLIGGVALIIILALALSKK